MAHLVKRWWIILGAVLLLGQAVLRAANGGSPPNANPAGVAMPVYPSPYYVVQADIDPDDAREAAIRVGKMFEEYRERTKGFSGQIREKLPLYLFKSEDEYHAAGGPAATGGYFNGKAMLVGVFGKHPDANTWRLLQHVGFYQFADAVIDRNMPVWALEGMGDYFGEGIFTGDSYVMGGIPPERLRRLKTEISGGGGSHLPTVNQIVPMDRALWAAQIGNARNSDKAWSMVHFLVHGEGGKYQKLFVNYILDLNHGIAPEKAWSRNFGDGGGFEERWKDYWTGLNDNPTDEVYARATVATLTSFLARAAAQRQVFKEFEEFESAAGFDQLKIADADRLPSSLLKSAMADAARRRNISAGQTILDGPAAARNRVVMTLPDGTRLAGTFTLAKGHPADVKVQTTPPPATRPTTPHAN